MGRITALFARKVVAQVAGVADAGDLLGTVGLQADGPADPRHMIRDADYYSLFEAAAEADADPTTLPLRVGASMRADDYGPFGFAWKSAPTLRGSFDRAQRYALILTSVSLYEVEDCFRGAYMHLHRKGQRRLGMRLSNEATLASIAAFFDTLLTAEVSTLDTDTPLERRVLDRLSTALSGGVPALHEVARELAMSGRTLQRRLAEAGHSYQSLVDDARRRLALRLLRDDSDASLTEVAFMTGFSDQSAFTRAFKRWTGTTPGAFRTEAGPGS